MSMLTEKLPDSVVICGREHSINSDFRVFLKIDSILQNSVDDEETGAYIIELFYNTIPNDIYEATKQMLWFFRCGKDIKPNNNSNARSANAKADFSYEHDAQYIYAAFLDQYGIDLADVKYLHWWKFRALFDSLRPEHTFSEIRKCRSIKITNDMSRAEKNYYKAMKKLYALPLAENEQKELEKLEKALIKGGDINSLL